MDLWIIPTPGLTFLNLTCTCSGSFSLGAGQVNPVPSHPPSRSLGVPVAKEGFRINSEVRTKTSVGGMEQQWLWETESRFHMTQQPPPPSALALSVLPLTSVHKYLHFPTYSHSPILSHTHIILHLPTLPFTPPHQLWTIKVNKVDISWSMACTKHLFLQNDYSLYQTTITAYEDSISEIIHTPHFLQFQNKKETRIKWLLY